MSIITFPSTLFFKHLNWSQLRNDIEFRSSFGAQAVEISSPLWKVAGEGAMINDDAAGEWKSLLMKLRGKTNQLELWDHMRPAPIGNMRGVLTFNAAPVVGDVALSITGGAGQAAKTLLKGDLLGFGAGLTQQVVMVVADATASGAGVIAVTVEPAIRNAFLIGDGVTWDRPKALFRRAEGNFGWDYSEMLVSGFLLDLIEDWRT